MNLFALRAAGIAGILGAICWAIGDVLLVGGNAAPADYPLLLVDYADRIPFKALGWMLSASEERLAAGALIADVSIPLYLAGAWHLYRGVRSAGAALSFAVLVLMVCGNAWSPLGHAGFYYPGMVYRAILEAPREAHEALLLLGSQFNRVLVFAYLLPVVTLAAGMLLLAIVVATGRSAYPRWAAVVLNPVTPLAVAALGSALPAPVGGWFYAAVLNVGFFVVYGLSTALLWNGGKAGRAHDAGHAP